MGNKKLKFGIGIAIILAVVAFEAVTAFQENKTYYVTVSELLSGKAPRGHIRVGGTVAADSIKHNHGTVIFRLAQNADVLPVVYVGSDTLPDNFKDGSQAIVDGQYDRDGTFRAEHVQAKCASKYQAVPGAKPGGNQAGPPAKKVASSRPAWPGSNFVSQ